MFRGSLALSILFVAVGSSSCSPEDPRGTRMSGTAGNFDAGWFYADGGAIPLGPSSPPEYDPSIAHLPNDDDEALAPTIDVPNVPVAVSVGGAPSDAGVEHEPSLTPGSEPAFGEPAEPEPAPSVPGSSSSGAPPTEPEPVSAEPPVPEPEATPTTPPGGTATPNPSEPEPEPSPSPVEPEPNTTPVPEPEPEPAAAPAPTPTLPRPAPTPTSPSPAPTPTVPSPIPTPTIPAPVPTPTVPVPVPTVTAPPKEPEPPEPEANPEPAPEPEADPCSDEAQCTPSCDPGFVHPVDENGCVDNCSCVALSPVCDTCASDEECFVEKSPDGTRYGCAVLVEDCDSVAACGCFQDYGDCSSNTDDVCECTIPTNPCGSCDRGQRCVYQTGVLLGIAASYTCAEADSCDGPTDCDCIEDQGDCAFDNGLEVCSCDNGLLPGLPLR
jgi:hypothetical protein